jgi:hypothetical protein
MDTAGGSGPDRPERRTQQLATALTGLHLAAKHAHENFLRSTHRFTLYVLLNLQGDCLDIVLTQGTPLCCCCCCCRFFYASSACIYPEHKQLETKVEGGGLKEGDAWPAQVRRLQRNAESPTAGLPAYLTEGQAIH